MFIKVNNTPYFFISTTLFITSNLSCNRPKFIATCYYLPKRLPGNSDIRARVIAGKKSTKNVYELQQIAEKLPHNTRLTF